MKLLAKIIISIIFILFLVTYVGDLIAWMLQNSWFFGIILLGAIILAVGYIISIQFSKIDLSDEDEDDINYPSLNP